MINGIFVIVYIVIGFALTLYWFNKDYKASHEEAVATKMEEKGMTSIFLLMLIVLWPIKLIYNLKKKKRI